MYIDLTNFEFKLSLGFLSSFVQFYERITIIMGKQYRITYKIFLNKRLKEVLFHDKTTHPLYIQLTYRRLNIVFKSYYFDLFAAKRYANPGKLTPNIEDVIAMERRVLEHIVDQNHVQITLVRLQKMYYFYSNDLCTSSEEVYGASLFLLLREHGNGSFARALANGYIHREQVLYEIVEDMSQLFRADVYRNLLQKMEDMQQFYIQLYGFMLRHKTSPYRYLSVLDWETGTTKSDFSAYLYSIGTYNPGAIIEYIDGWVANQIKVQ